MDVLAAGLVLDERERVRQLADVVVVGRDAREQRIGADRLRRPLREVPDHQRVVVGPGRLDEKPPEQGLRRVRQLEQLKHRHESEQLPSTANVPTAATADPAADAIEAPTSCSSP